MTGYAKYFDSNKIMTVKVINKKTIKKVYSNMGKN